MAVSGIPVKMYNQIIGTALVNDDGTIDLNIDGPCQLGKNFLASLEKGQYAGLNVAFSLVPQPANPSIGTSGIQIGDRNTQVNNF